MFSPASLLGFLAFSMMRSPVEVRNSHITLPVTRRLTVPNVTDLLQHDEARVAVFREYSTHGRCAYLPLSNTIMGYTVTVAIGPKIYNSIVDSASAITWVGASTAYVNSTGIDTKVPVAFDYGYGSFKGTIFEDKSTFTEEITIPRMQFGVASTSQGIGFNGILGIGPTVSSLSVLPNPPEDTIQTVH